jgi:hypothetical protein
MTESLAVEERGRTVTFTFDDMLRFHDGHSPAGVAVAFKAMQRGFAALSPGAPLARRNISVRTAFRGPGARDGFEAVRPGPCRLSRRRSGAPTRHTERPTRTTADRNTAHRGVRARMGMR